MERSHALEASRQIRYKNLASRGGISRVKRVLGGVVLAHRIIVQDMQCDAGPCYRISQVYERRIGDLTGYTSPLLMRPQVRRDNGPREIDCLLACEP